MRKTVSLIFIFFWLASGASKTAAQDLQNTEADELDAKVIKLYQEGQSKKALPLAKRAVELRLAVAKRNQATVKSLYNLATIYERLFDLGAALPVLEEARKINQVLSPEDLSSATILDKIGRVHHFQRDGASAARAYSQSLSIKEKVLGEQHPNVIQTVLRLALLLTSTGQNEDAERLFDRFFRSKDALSVDLQSQFEGEIQQFACELRSVGNATASDKLEAKLSIISVVGPSDSGNKASGTEAINGRATHLSFPQYPAIARSARASGKVYIRVIIDETGQPIFACVLDGHPLLQHAAKQAALKSRFTPTLRNGRAVRVAGTIIYNFEDQ